jgi:hypothetical protein
MRTLGHPETLRDGSFNILATRDSCPMSSVQSTHTSYDIPDGYFTYFYRISRRFVTNGFLYPPTQNYVWQVSRSTLLAYSPVSFIRYIQNPRVEFRQIILQSFCKLYLYSFVFDHCIPQLRMDKAPVEVKATPVPFEGSTQPFNIGV